MFNNLGIVKQLTFGQQPPANTLFKNTNQNNQPGALNANTTKPNTASNPPQPNFFKQQQQGQAQNQVQGQSQGLPNTTGGFFKQKDQGGNAPNTGFFGANKPNNDSKIPPPKVGGNSKLFGPTGKNPEAGIKIGAGPSSGTANFFGGQNAMNNNKPGENKANPLTTAATANPIQNNGPVKADNSNLFFGMNNANTTPVGGTQNANPISQTNPTNLTNPVNPTNPTAGGNNFFGVNKKTDPKPTGNGLNLNSAGGNSFFGGDKKPALGKINLGGDKKVNNNFKIGGNTQANSKLSFGPNAKQPGNTGINLNQPGQKQNTNQNPGQQGLNIGNQPQANPNGQNPNNMQGAPNNLNPQKKTLESVNMEQFLNLKVGDMVRGWEKSAKELKENVKKVGMVIHENEEFLRTNFETMQALGGSVNKVNQEYQNLDNDLDKIIKSQDLIQDKLDILDSKMNIFLERTDPTYGSMDDSEKIFTEGLKVNSKLRIYDQEFESLKNEINVSGRQNDFEQTDESFMESVNICLESFVNLENKVYAIEGRLNHISNSKAYF